MTDRNELAASIIARDYISTAAKPADERKQLAALMAAAGDAAINVVAVDGTKLGRATYCAGEPVAAVTDEAAFKKWVAENRPDMIRTSVDAAYKTAMLKTAEDGVVVDKDTGEIIPGIGMVDKAGYVSFKVTPEAKQRLAAALEGTELAALTAVPEPEPEPVFDKSDYIESEW